MSDMDLRFSQFEVVTATGAFFLCLLFVCIFLEASNIEQELGATAVEAVSKQDLFWAGVEPSGQDIVLTGAAPDYAAKKKAGQIAASVWGVSSVDNQIAIIGESGACQARIDDLLTRRRVAFKKGKAELTESSYSLLGILANLARNCHARLEIASHSDAEGDSTINLKLTQRRADAVRKYLVQRGVEPEQIDARGYGESQPIADNSTAEGREANQRIEFRVIGDMA
jgi:outer membrane protein OmpA-like peptidoglycan-associated protein